ncbi:hypothetical protein ABFV05_020194 [Capra hircus]
MPHFLTSGSQRDWGPGIGGRASGAGPQLGRGENLNLYSETRGSRNQEQRSEACVQRSEKRGGPGSTRSQGIVLEVKMSELRKPKKDLQDPGEAQGPEEAQLLGAERGEAATPSASSRPISLCATEEALPQEALNKMVANMDFRELVLCDRPY